MMTTHPIKCRPVGIVVNAILFFLGVCFYPSNAQVRKIDSLSAAIPVMPEDTNKVNALIDLGLMYLSTSDYTATQTCLEVLHSLSNQLNHKRGIRI